MKIDIRTLNRDLGLCSGGTGIKVEPGPIDGVMFRVSDTLFVKATRGTSTRLVIVDDYIYKGQDSSSENIAQLLVDIIHAFGDLYSGPSMIDRILEPADDETKYLLLSIARRLVASQGK